jgi:hypothetical protein
MAAAGPLAWGLMALAAVGAALLVAAELSTITSIEIGAAECADRAFGADRDICSDTGGERHGYALILLALLVVVMAWGAAAGRSRPAALALLVVGGVVLGIALLGDLPETDDTRGLEIRYTEVTAEAQSGLTLEIVAGALIVLAGVAGFFARREPDEEEET